MQRSFTLGISHDRGGRTDPNEETNQLGILVGVTPGRRMKDRSTTMIQLVQFLRPAFHHPRDDIDGRIVWNQSVEEVDVVIGGFGHGSHDEGEGFIVNDFGEGRPVLAMDESEQVEDYSFEGGGGGGHGLVCFGRRVY
jgi:hypothetical protein